MEAAVRSDSRTISSAGFVLKMIGIGGHVARPHEAVDPIGMAAMVIVAGKTIVSTRVNPLDPAIVAFASIIHAIAAPVYVIEIWSEEVKHLINFVGGVWDDYESAIFCGPNLVPHFTNNFSGYEFCLHGYFLISNLSNTL